MTFRTPTDPKATNPPLSGDNFRLVLADEARTSFMAWAYANEVALRAPASPPPPAKRTPYLNAQRWTDTEERYIRQNYWLKSDKEMAGALMRGHAAVRQRRLKLGLTRGNWR